MTRELRKLDTWPCTTVQTTRKRFCFSGLSQEHMTRRIAGPLAIT